MTDPIEASRKDKILDAAEKAFADNGFDGASLRQIVADASVNLATVYYYFESKEGLMEAVVERRLGPLKRAQLARLKEIQAEAGGPLPVEVILDHMLKGALALAMPGSAENQMAMRVLGRMITDPNPKIQERLRARHEPVRQAFFQAFQQALPKLPSRDLFWRLEFIWGAMAFILCNPSWSQNRAFGCCESVDKATVLPQMISFFAAGLRAAPVTAPDISPCPFESN